MFPYIPLYSMHDNRNVELRECKPVLNFYVKIFQIKATTAVRAIW